MNTGFLRKLVAVLTVVFMTTTLSIPASAVEADTPNLSETQQATQTQQAGLKGVPLSINANSKAKRTIMLYDCGADLETDAGLATYNLNQILESHFSSDEDIRFLVMTGGSHKWQIDSSKLAFPDGVSLPNDAVVEYNPDTLSYVDNPSDPKSQVSNVYNQIWEAKGKDATDGNAGKLVLLDGDGITGNNDVTVTHKLRKSVQTLRNMRWLPCDSLYQHTVAVVDFVLDGLCHTPGKRRVAREGARERRPLDRRKTKGPHLRVQDVR